MSEVATREGWLQDAIKALTPLFTENDIELPEVRVSVGFPGGGGPNRIGECWSPESSADGIPQLFIHPKLGELDPVLATLTHELIHAVDGCKNGHSGPFKKMAQAIGLEGRMTATVPSAALCERFAELLKDAGMSPYPHSILEGGKKSGPKPQKNRQHKLTCPGCGMIVRTSNKWIDEVGPPNCLCGNQFEVEERDD